MHAPLGQQRKRRAQTNAFGTFARSRNEDLRREEEQGENRLCPVKMARVVESLHQNRHHHLIETSALCIEQQ